MSEMLPLAPSSASESFSQTWRCQMLSTTVPTPARSTPGSWGGGGHHTNTLLGMAFVWWAKPGVGVPALGGNHPGGNGSSGMLFAQRASPQLCKGAARLALTLCIVTERWEA